MALYGGPVPWWRVVRADGTLPESHGPARRLDLPALPLIAGASMALTWGLVRGGGSSWSDGFTVALLAGATELMLLFAGRGRRHAP